MSQSVFRINHPTAGLEKFENTRAEATKMAEALIKLSERCMCPTTLVGLAAAQRFLQLKKSGVCSNCGDECLDHKPENQEAILCEDCQSDFDSMDLEDKLEELMD